MPLRPRLLCLCSSYPPEITPTAIRTGQILRRLTTEFAVEVLTGVPVAASGSDIALTTIPDSPPRRLPTALRRMKLEKFADWLEWPDAETHRIKPALRTGLNVVARERPDAIVAFMMPYSAGIAAVRLKQRTGLPLILNLDDSPTCRDMHPFFPTRLHYTLARRLEDWYVQQADAVIYVSQLNLEAVRDRQRPEDRRKFHLVRYGAETPVPLHDVASPESFRVVYLGGMSGWYAFYHRPEEQSLPRRLYRAWMELGRYTPSAIDQRGSSPVYVGQAVNAAMCAHPEWQGRIRAEIYGNKYPAHVVARVLENTGIQQSVSVCGPVPNAEATALAGEADLLFLALPARRDETPGGRISAKTYEYLMTDRPILAAVPPGENRDYLEGKPGVWIVEPDDPAGMERVIAELAAAKFAGKPVTFDRSALRSELSYDARAREFADVVKEVLARQRPS